MRDDLKKVTVVFEINDCGSFEGMWNKLHDLFSAPEGSPYRVTALSCDDEIGRLFLISEALERYSDTDERDHAIDMIWNCQDMSKWSWDAYEAEFA